VSHDSSLEPVLQAVEPAVRLVPERHYREVIHYLTDRGNPQPANTRLPCWVARDVVVAAELLSPQARSGTEPQLLLVTDPDDRMIDHWPREQQLLVYWRVLFQAAVLQRIDQQVQAGLLTEARSSEQLQRLGPAADREIRFVLESEHLVSPDATDLGRYRSFAAVYLELAHFAPHTLDDYFPSLPPREQVLAMLRDVVEPAALMASTRPAGAADPEREPEPHELWETPPVRPSSSPPLVAEDPRGLLRRAAEAEAIGNHVRAAILRTQAAATLSPADRDAALHAARTNLARLVDDLAQMFEWDDATQQEWRQALTPLLEPAAEGIWPRAARCLYELQKLPADLARDVFAVDLPEAIRTLGRRPIKRPLPRARPVLILMGLKRAASQMLRTDLERTAQLRLDRLFHHQIHELERTIRQEFTPIVTQALTAARLIPANQVEVVAREKLVAELLDRVCERGYLRFGDVRDAIARNQLKMRDLDRTQDFFRGDALLQADLHLAHAMDGVYRKGEFYLRWLQRFSAVFFGTPVGRWFTLFLAIPFLGSFLTLTFAEHVWHKIDGLFGSPASSAPPRPEPTAPAATTPGTPTPPPRLITPDEVFVDDEGEIWWEPAEPERQPFDTGNVFVGDWFRQAPAPALAQAVIAIPSQPTSHPHEEPTFLTDRATILGFGVFLLLVLHVPPVRRLVGVVLRHLWRILRAVLWDGPLALWRSNFIRRLRQSYPVRFLHRHFWSPLVITALLFGGMVLLGVRSWFLVTWGWAIWAGLTLAYNTPWGWLVQDRVTEALSDWWRVVRVNLIPGLIDTFISWFKRLGNWIERQLYAVDEWFRFRGGDSQGSLALKALLGLLWFPVAYLFRFVFYVLVEPQINPVKHFPVVTVSHKVIWPLVPDLARATGISPWTAGMIINGIPGVFGFIAWELRANWLLYAANRSDRLRPVQIGSHGESMRELLRPGFHSGTIPKLFKKLRHSSAARVDRLHHELDHTAEGVHRFLDRELIALLHQSPEWGGVPMAIHAIRFGCQRLRVEFEANGLCRQPFVLSFENIAGSIEATIDQLGWVDQLTTVQQATLVAALRGVLDLAAVDRYAGQERVESAVPLGAGFADLARRVGWEEWVERWHRPSGSPAVAASSALS
jgi:hypothetical protein